MTLTDGTQLSEWVRDVRGTADNPMTRAEVTAKARDLMSPVLGGGRAELLVESVLGLEHVKDVRDLRPLLRRA